MAYGYRYRRRSFRRGYRRYRRYGTSLRRYRSVQMNDNETKVMTFTSVSIGTVPVGLTQTLTVPVLNLLNGTSTSPDSVGPAAGRLFFAGMMFDRLRFRSISCTIRPRVMPNSTATNYTLYASWDRYGGARISSGAPQSEGYSIQSDPSAKQITWSSGGSGSPLRTYIYSTSKDRYQYLPIYHNNGLVSWNLPKAIPSGASDYTSSPFYPILMLAVDAVTTEGTVPSVSILTRATVEFQGGYSSTSLNYSPSSGASVLSAKTLSSLPPGSVYELRRFVNNEAQKEEEVATNNLSGLTEPSDLPIIEDPPGLADLD